MGGDNGEDDKAEGDGRNDCEEEQMDNELIIELVQTSGVDMSDDASEFAGND